ncbi:MAG TPA: N-6 DNA methylase [Pirellulales bacterium]|nr:N-6 DNA methylase [Pirellulales bacterium]
MPRLESLDEQVARKAADFADQIRAVAATADTEEEIRIAVERQLAFVEKEVGVELEGQHEFTIAKGRIDSLYSRVIIEYKNPSDPAARIGPRADSPGTKKVVEQIQRRFYALRSEQRQPLNTLFGVGLDGNHFVFVRFRDDKWQVQEPVEVTKYSVERFLWALLNLGRKGKPFSADYLAGDFGSEAPVAQDGIRALYDAIKETDHPKAQTFFNQWKILFGEVCGYDVENPSAKIKKLASSYGVPAKGLRSAELLFAVHTYYAIFMKLLAAEIVAFFHRLPAPPRRMMEAPTSAKLLRELEELEAGGIFRHLNITNFLEGDLFAWYTTVWSEPIEKLVRNMVARLDDYNPGTFSENPAESRDLLKQLYQQLFPKSVRHDLGEYYTPDWLAEHVLNELGYEGDPEKRLLDPACGSGTFLVMAINRIRGWFDQHREKCRYGESELVQKILANVVGFDLNPLAVMAARTNYLIAIRDLVTHADKIEIPIYLCDSIVTPSEYGGLFAGEKLGKARELKTAAATFLIPTEVARTRDDIARYAEQLEFCVRNGYSAKEFVARCTEEGLPVTADSLHTGLYRELVKLDKANKNGVWARIIKNAFAPLFIGKVDYVAGNPPWVNWESLPSEYREATKPLWERYGLFSLRGHAARLGGGKKDLSMLFVYLCLDVYLEDGGELGFVVTQSLFKTRAAGEGFRRFTFQRRGEKVHIVPVSVIDMTDLHPFEGATNRTASFVCRVSGSPTEWPVPYEIWRLKEGNAVDERADFTAIGPQVDRKKLGALPMQDQELGSAWLTAAADAIPGLKKVMGASEVKAHAGVCTWMNGVFWLESVVPARKDHSRIANWHDVGKIKVDRIDTVIEDALIYPLLRGRDVHRWSSKPSTQILLTQDPETRTGISEAIMKRRYPLSYQYLRNFKELLSGRPGYLKYFDVTKDPFWTIYNIGPYSLSPHRVLFKELTDFFQCAVPDESSKPAIADTKLRFIDCSSATDAHFLCGLLNSGPAVLYLYSTATWVQTADYQASDISRLRLPRFDESNDAHAEVVDLSRQCHAAVARDDRRALASYEAQLDDVVQKIWNISQREMRAIHVALADLGFGQGSSSPDEDEEL